MSADCLFCKIAKKEIPSKIAYEDDFVLGFHDISPQAPVHILFIPKKHLETVDEVKAGDDIISKLTHAAAETARKLGVSEKGYRLIMNCRQDGGQVVYHLHLHLMGGRPMKGLG